MLRKHCIDLVGRPEDKLIPRSLEKRGSGEDSSAAVTARSQ